MPSHRIRAAALLAPLALAACRQQQVADTPAPSAATPAAAPAAPGAPTIAQRLAKYTTVRLTTDLSALTANERAMIPLLIDAAKAMDEIWWQEAYGEPGPFLASIADPQLRRFAEINYGPWDRLAGNEPFLPGVGAKPAGARFYPADMTKAEFERALAAGGPRADSLKSLYTLVRRDAAGALVAVPYHAAFAPQVLRAAEKLEAAARLADDAGLRNYLTLRARALRTDDYQPSDMAWLDMKTNTIDMVVGPIETYEDGLFGYKAGHEAYVLVKDREWSRRLARYAALLPSLQQGLPVAEAYRREVPGTDAELNAYDAVYYAGEANAGSKTIAINLPNDEEVQLKKGTRRLQLKNAMRAKFDRILVPVAAELIAADQRANVTFDAFFGNTMFHEVAHGLGIKNTINGRGTVREALKEQASALEEGKADVLGLYMVTALIARNEVPGGNLRDHYVTFVASIFRSVRFGAASAHGRANIARFNFLAERGAIARDAATGTWRVDEARMQSAMNELSATILKFQGDGDHAGVVAFMEKYGRIGAELQGDLDRLSTKGIPVDVVFEQGVEVLK